MSFSRDDSTVVYPSLLQRGCDDRRSRDPLRAHPLVTRAVCCRARPRLVLYGWRPESIALCSGPHHGRPPVKVFGPSQCTALCKLAFQLSQSHLFLPSTSLASGVNASVIPCRLQSAMLLRRHGLPRLAAAPVAAAARSKLSLRHAAQQAARAASDSAKGAPAQQRIAGRQPSCSTQASKRWHGLAGAGAFALLLSFVCPSALAAKVRTIHSGTCAEPAWHNLHGATPRVWKDAGSSAV